MRYIGTTPNPYGDTLLTSDADDQINVKVAGAEDFRIAANTLSVLSGTTLNIDSGATIANSGTATGFGGGLSAKTLNVVYNTATASGDQVITGVGFLPKAVIVINGVAHSAKVSIATSDGTTNQGIMSKDNITADQWDNMSKVASTVHSSGNLAQAVVKTFDADGMTLTWTKTGSPTGITQLECLFIT